MYYMEGGFRMPAIAWWPGTISPGQVSSAVINTMDIFPTLVELSGAAKNANQLWQLDGHSFASLLRPSVPTVTSSRDHLQYFYCGRILVAVRYLSYKIYFYKSRFLSADIRQTLCRNGFPLREHFEVRCPDEMLKEWLIFDVVKDPSEEWPLEVKPLESVVSNVSVLILEHQETLLDSREPILINSLVKSYLGPCCNPPFCFCNYKVKIS